MLMVGRTWHIAPLCRSKQPEKAPEQGQKLWKVTLSFSSQTKISCHRGPDSSTSSLEEEIPSRDDVYRRAVRKCSTVLN